MSKWLPAVDTAEGARDASKAGAYGALGFAAMLAVGLAFLLIAGHMPKEAATDIVFPAIGISVELVVALACAWRFWNNKGLFIGLLVAAIFVFEIFNKLATGSTNVGWMFCYAAVMAGLLNGLRGAWAHRATKGYVATEPAHDHNPPHRPPTIRKGSDL